MPRFRHFLSVLPSLLACAGERPSASAPLVYYESYDPRSLDPALSTDVPTGEMVTLAYDGLTRFDVNGRLQPALSDRWTTDPRGLRYVFHLRAGVRFADSSPVTVAAVRQSFLRVLDPKSTGGRAWPLLPIGGARAYAAGTARDVPGIELLGDSAVALTLEQPLAVFPKFLAMPVASIVAPRSGVRDVETIGTGPWRFVSWAHDDALRYARNPGYWDGPPQAESLVVRIIPDQLVRAAELEAGRLDVVEVPFGETAAWRSRHANWLQEKPALRDVYIALNNRRGALRDARVRQAINYAVNVPQILATVYGGRGIRARGAIPPSLAGGDTTREAYTYDPARAKQLLAAAGLAAGVTLELWRAADNETLGRVAQAVQSDLEQVGIQIEIVARDASSQRAAARAGNADMAILDWWADYPDGDDFLFPLFSSTSFGPGGNYAFYSDAVTDSLLLAARRTQDDAARERLYRAIDERVYRAAPWLYLWFPVDLWAESPRITGWELPVIFNGQRWTGVRRATPP
ncbi:MAG TPA: ABC transporter substrate-binding protein [Gemmatimonadales bacterium]|nr:ABC transporter substrate-binding protein [Gemmatimonadales bacterium]